MEMTYAGETLLPGKFGQLFIVLSFTTALLAFIAYTFATFKKEEAEISSWRKIGRISYAANAAMVIAIGAVLFYLILNHFNEYYYVYQHSSKELPVYYIVSAFWEGQEGSFWLWAFWQGLLGLILIRTARSWENPVMMVVSLSQVFLASTLLGVSLFGGRIGSSPFILLREAFDLKEFAPMVFSDPENMRKYLTFIQDGKGLNPLLQNYWMVIHPPTLFLGFASMIVPFAFAFAGILQRRYREWLKPALPWALFAVLILGAGIIMGSFWAYEALNFDGFWAWDPVENASLIPWLCLVAALHVMIAFKQTGHAFVTSVVLVFLSYILVLYASFLTRSGVLGDTSVHSFTDMGMFGHLVLYNVVFLALPAVLLVWRWKELPITQKEEETYSREFWLFIGSLILVIACVQVIFTTSVPVFNKAFNTSFAPPLDKIAYYNKWQAPFALLIVIMSGFTQYLKFKRSNKNNFWQRMSLLALASAVITFLVVWLTGIYTNTMYVLLCFGCIFSIIANGGILIKLFKPKYKLNGAAVAHIGFALMLLGALISAATQKVVSVNASNYIPVKDFEKAAKPGENILLNKNEPVRMGKYFVTYTADTLIAPNTIYSVNFRHIDSVTNQVKEDFTIHPLVQVNEKMGLISSPDTKHFINSDIYTHVTSASPKQDTHAEDVNDDDNYQQAKEFTVKQGDTIRLKNGFVIKVGQINTQPVLKEIKLAANDLAVGLPLLVQNGVSSFKTEPVFMVKGNNTFNFARKIDELGLKFRFLQILPQEDKVVLQVLEKNENQKDWIVIKAIKFPFIGYYWAGAIIMVAGMGLSINSRLKNRS